MMKDPAFLAEAKKSKLETNMVSGERMEALIDRLFRTPPAIVERAKKIVRTE